MRRRRCCIKTAIKTSVLLSFSMATGLHISKPPLGTNTTPSVNIITHLDSEVPRVGGDVCHAADELVPSGAGSQWLEGHVVAPADHLEEGGQVMKAVLPPPLHPQKEIDLHRGHRKLVFRGGYS